MGAGLRYGCSGYGVGMRLSLYVMGVVGLSVYLLGDRIQGGKVKHVCV